MRYHSSFWLASGTAGVANRIDRVKARFHIWQHFSSPEFDQILEKKQFSAPVLIFFAVFSGCRIKTDDILQGFN